MEQAQPGGERLRVANRMSTPLAITLDLVGRSKTPSKAKRLPRVSWDAPGKVLAVDEGSCRQVENHRSTHDGCHQRPVRCRLGPSDHGIAPHENAETPEHRCAEEGRQQPSHKE